MDLVVGTILDGKVSGIMKFGAFVSLPGGKSGLVHISEIAYSYVNEVKDFLTEGQDVKVKIIGIDETGRINLSIKKAVERAPVPASPKATDRPPVNRHSSSARTILPRDNYRNQQTADSSFEDKLKQFMVDSDSRMSGIKLYSDKKSSSSRRNKGK
ncbi:MAG: S1 RNA-binding domain-containing protein [Clostridiales bacterium]|nr:S1 RNA-binding domain-containing protein [Clostridiales bacterium]